MSKPYVFLALAIIGCGRNETRKPLQERQVDSYADVVDVDKWETDECNEGVTVTLEEEGVIRKINRCLEEEDK